MNSFPSNRGKPRRPTSCILLCLHKPMWQTKPHAQVPLLPLLGFLVTHLLGRDRRRHRHRAGMSPGGGTRRRRRRWLHHRASPWITIAPFPRARVNIRSRRRRIGNGSGHRFLRVDTAHLATRLGSGLRSRLRGKPKPSERKGSKTQEQRHRGRTKKRCFCFVRLLGSFFFFWLPLLSLPRMQNAIQSNAFFSVSLSRKYELRDLRRISEDVVNGSEEFVGPNRCCMSCGVVVREREKEKGKKRWNVTVKRMYYCFLSVILDKRGRERECACVRVCLCRIWK